MGACSLDEPQPKFFPATMKSPGDTFDAYSLSMSSMQCLASSAGSLVLRYRAGMITSVSTSSPYFQALPLNSMRSAPFSGFLAAAIAAIGSDSWFRLIPRGGFLSAASSREERELAAAAVCAINGKRTKQEGPAEPPQEGGAVSRSPGCRCRRARAPRGSMRRVRRGARPRRTRCGTAREGDEAGVDAAALECRDLREWPPGGRSAAVRVHRTASHERSPPPRRRSRMAGGSSVRLEDGGAERRELGRIRDGELHPFSRGGVEEPEVERVEEKTTERHRRAGGTLPQRYLPGPAVDVVPHDRARKGRAVDANLVGPTRFQAELHEGKGSIRLDAPVMSHCIAPALGEHRHLFPVHRVPPYLRDDRTARSRRLSQDDAVVAPIHHPVRGELCREVRVHLVGLGYHEDPGGIPVEAVNDPRPHHAADAGEPIGTGQKDVHERPARMPGGGVHHHPGRLLHHDQVLILKQDPEGTVLGDEIEGTRGRHGDGDHLVPPHPRRGACRGRAYAHVPLPDQLLDPGSGKTREGAGQETVQSFSRLSGGYGDPMGDAQLPGLGGNPPHGPDQDVDQGLVEIVRTPGDFRIDPALVIDPPFLDLPLQKIETGVPSDPLLHLLRVVKGNVRNHCPSDAPGHIRILDDPHLPPPGRNGHWICPTGRGTLRTYGPRPAKEGRRPSVLWEVPKAPSGKRPPPARAFG